MIKIVISSLIISIFFLGCLGLGQPKKVLKTKTSVVFPKENIITQEPTKGDIFEKRALYLPPIISHTIEKLKITHTQNDCISCHNRDNNQKLQSHYDDFGINSSYKNCFSCHLTR